MADSDAITLGFIRDCIRSGRIRWTYHSSMRLEQRGLKAETLAKGVASLEILEAYPHDKYLPSYLLRGEFRGDLFHALVAIDTEGGNVRVVTMYRPSADEWDDDYRVRKAKR